MRTLDEIHEVIIHCADTPDGVDKYTIKDIDDWHRERHFKRSVPGELTSVGYHAVIHVDGSLHKGRTPEEEGAHTLGHNHQSLGVCLIGREKFTLKQWEALRKYIIDATEGLGRPLAIYGHRAFATHKLCPGFDVETWLAGGMAPLLEHLIKE